MFFKKVTIRYKLNGLSFIPGCFTLDSVLPSLCMILNRLILLLLLLSVILWACDEAPAPTPGADALEVYTKYCVLCHGNDGRRGLNGAGDLTKSTLLLEERIQQITLGKGLMTPYAGILTPEEIAAVAAYTMTLEKQ